MTQATRSNLMSVATTLAANIDATQDYIPVASTANFSTSVVAEVETTNEVVSFTDISSNSIYPSTNLSSTPQSSGVTLTHNVTGISAPDGTDTVSYFVPTAASGLHYARASAGISSPSTGGSTLYTGSVFAKANGYNFVVVQLTSGTSGGGSRYAITVDLTNGTIGGFIDPENVSNVSSTATSVGNDWYRITLTVSFDTANSGPLATLYMVGAYSDNLSSVNPATSTNATPSFTGDGSSGVYIWGFQVEQASAATTYLPTTSAALVGLTDVTRGANGTTAASATSGDDIQQLPYALLNVDMPVRLKGLSVSSDGTGAGRLTLCDKVGTHLCDVDIPDTKIFDLTFDGGILFPNGIYVANSDNLTAYTLYTSGYNSPNLTAGG